ncbi:siderophore-interacting protein [Rhizohabitans arisaemae]|uniref:siderophore-interacting protein n=1 Tax=Rhizohabitans arisaemae TaxID=2720610 RepID=UPI0024B0C10A|nr:siderophore-interacting protein [Rhizohabitans arisaemae]
MAYSALDRLQLKVVGKVASLMMAMPAPREHHEQFRMTVVRAEWAGPHIRRITFAAEEFTAYTVTGPDEYFGLIMPPPGEAEPVMPPERLNVRQAIQKMPADRRPDLRWYTVRAHRPEAGEIDVDFILHGDAGPGSRWAGAAEPGWVAGFRAGGSSYRRAAPGERQLLVADETGMPALSAILESLPAPAEGITALVEVPGESYRLPVTAAVEPRYLYRGEAPAGTLALPELAGEPMADLGYAWVCGEAGLASGVRRHLVKERGVDRRRIMFSGYWKVGQARL